MPASRRAVWTAATALAVTPFVSPAPATELAPEKAAVEARLLERAAANVEHFRKADARLVFRTADGRPCREAAVHVEQKRHAFLFGCIAFDLVGDEPAYRPRRFRERFRELFNLAVFPFYWPSYEAEQGMTHWERMIDTLRWCREEGITAKGHPLVWACQSGTPAWLKGLPEEETEELLRTRVRNLVRGFAGRIDLWDVVNEATNVRTWRDKIRSFDDPNDWDVQEEIPAIADYVDSAFRWAHGANPSATLLLNEYNTIARPPVRERFLALVRALQARGTPLSGLGIQAHEPREHWYPPEELWATLDALAGTGLPLHITELHPQSSGKPITGGWREGTWTEAAQAEFTEQLVRLCFGHPAVRSITWWGLSDRNIWLPGGGLLDAEYRPKPVFERLRKLREEWTTRLDLRTDSEGAVSFRGFLGDYDLTVVPPGGSPRILRVEVRPDEENRWAFTLGD
jgi:endo-1,4-beta-xylanase